MGDQSKMPARSRFGGISQEPNNTPKKLINFFNKEMVHGKRFMQRDVSEVDENPAKVQ